MPNLSQQSTEIYYTCGRCSYYLFSHSEVLHSGIQESNDDSEVSMGKAAWSPSENSYKGVGGTCSSVFLKEAPNWLQDVSSNTARIQCPKCNAKIGSYSWSGAQCSCTRWITPAFQFLLSKVDPKGVIQLPDPTQQRHSIKSTTTDDRMLV